MLLAPAKVSASTADKRLDKPNVVIIFCDDLGYGDVGCCADDCPFQTPAIDRMAEQGARLTNFHVPVGYCAPSRATLLTGRYPFRHGLWRNPGPGRGRHLDAGEVLLSQLLKRQGYATYLVGKWHLGHEKPQWLPTGRGFDHYYGIPYSNDMRPVRLLEDDQVVEYPVVQCTLTRRYTERALRFIEANHDRPFFLHFCHAMPHKPLAPHEAFYRKMEARDLYGDVIAELDWSTKQILAKLEELRIERRTLVIFTSNNGPWFGGCTGGLRGMKGRTWEGGIRVPLIAYMPGTIPPGHVNDALTGSTDIFPTVLQMAGIPLPDDRTIDGRDMMPALTSDAPSPHEVIFSQTGPRLMTVTGCVPRGGTDAAAPRRLAGPAGSPNRPPGLPGGTWKLHVFSPGGRRLAKRLDDWIDPNGPDGVTLLAPYEQPGPRDHPGLLTGDGPRKMMLFNLEQNRGEQHDVAAENPEVIAWLLGHFEAVVAKGPAAVRKASTLSK